MLYVIRMLYIALVKLGINMTLNDCINAIMDVILYRLIHLASECIHVLCARTEKLRADKNYLSHHFWGFKCKYVWEKLWEVSKLKTPPVSKTSPILSFLLKRSRKPQCRKLKQRATLLFMFFPNAHTELLTLNYVRFSINKLNCVFQHSNILFHTVLLTHSTTNTQEEIASTINGL